MQMQGSRQLAATQDQAWQALNDPAVLQACIPGCESFSATADNAYEAITAIKIGPVSAKFTGQVTLSNIQPPKSYDLAFVGNGGGAGFGNGQSSVSLEPRADGGCTLSYSVNAQVGGKIAQLGQRLIDGVAKSLADDFFKRFEAQLAALHPISITPDSIALHAQYTRAEGQFDIKNMLHDLQNPPYTYVYAAAVGAALMMAVLWLSR